MKSEAKGEMEMIRNYNDRWDGKGYVDAIPSDELEEAIQKVEEGSRAEKYLSVLVEASKRHKTTDAREVLYNEEEGGGRFTGRLKALYCPTCKKKVPYGYTRCAKPVIQRCTRCGQTVNVTQEMLDKR